MVFKNNRKGSIFDAMALIILPIFLIVIIFGFFIGYQALNEELVGLENTTTISGYNESLATFSQQANSFSSFWDFIFMLLIFGMWLAIMIAAFLLGNNPIFFVVYIILAMVLLVPAFILKFAMSDFINDTFILVYSVEFPMLTFFVNQFIYFALFFLVTIGIALYLKPGGVQQ